MLRRSWSSGSSWYGPMVICRRASAAQAMKVVRISPITASAVSGSAAR